MDRCKFVGDRDVDSVKEQARMSAFGVVSPSVERVLDGLREKKWRCRRLRFFAGNSSGSDFIENHYKNHLQVLKDRKERACFDICWKLILNLLVISYGDDLIECLRNKRDLNTLRQSVDGINMIKSSCETDFSEIKNLLEEYQSRINECKKKIDNAKSEVIADADIDSLQKELQEELNKEDKCREELRSVFN
ncbi:hypothetical protein NE237_023401 [Protea cynaroides]|uniref:Uncharacterized protein n=1 Tax=Protea cynaroides TaxID=273540 RepID=A0A9Q0HG74_9MAGN|nr:hypothetical protein NE237_023401 [Protea cynaroides]